MNRTRCFFHPDQLRFKPLYEWAFGDKIDHPETTARAENILAALREASEEFEVVAPKKAPWGAIRTAHDPRLIQLYQTASLLPAGETFYPSVFPKDAIGQGNPTNIRHAGAYCFDSGTPLDADTLSAASWSAACAYDAARHVAAGAPLAYALSRPPGHHATRKYFGGYSYFNNSAIAAKYLRRRKLRVAVLDIDFHHGNGTQSMFERDDHVLTVSIHGDPREYYPFYCGFSDELGKGRGAGHNLNLPLPTGTDGDTFVDALNNHLLPAIQHFAPDALVVAAGLDAYHKDPVGGFALTTEDFRRVGAAIATLQLPTVAVQEGGYYTPDLGANAVALLRGLRSQLD